MYNIAFSVRNSKTGRILILYSVFTLLIYIMFIMWNLMMSTTVTKIQSNRSNRLGSDYALKVVAKFDAKV